MSSRRVLAKLHGEELLQKGFSLFSVYTLFVCLYSAFAYAYTRRSTCHIHLVHTYINSHLYKYAGKASRSFCNCKRHLSLVSCRDRDVVLKSLLLCQMIEAFCVRLLPQIALFSEHFSCNIQQIGCGEKSSLLILIKSACLERR